MQRVYSDLEPQQVYRLHENEKKRQYSSRVLDIEHGTFTPLIFTTTGGKECLNYHSRLAELIAIKKGEDYTKTISWIRARTSFALMRSAFICSLRGNRSTLRKSWDFRNTVQCTLLTRFYKIRVNLMYVNVCFFTEALKDLLN